MNLVVKPNGSIKCLYDEALDLARIGPLTIARASHVEPEEKGQWTADLSPANGPVLGPFRTRTEALRAERIVPGKTSAIGAGLRTLTAKVVCG